MTSYGLLELVLHSGGAHMTSHNKHHGGLHVVLAEAYKIAHNFTIKDQTCLELFSMGSILVLVVYQPKQLFAL